MNRTHWNHALFAFVASVGLAGAASCLSGDDAPAGRRVEHPPQPVRAPVASAKPAQVVRPLPSDGPFTPLDQAIVDDCDRPKDKPWAPGRPWSENVPDRDCTNDGECGDGFCDRGHCAAIWTCREPYGQRCINGRTAPNSRLGRGFECLCLDGRCRSCASDAECQAELGAAAAVCARRDHRGFRYCVIGAFKAGVGGHDMGPPPRDRSVPGDNASGDRSAPGGGQAFRLPAPKPVNGQARASSKNVPVLNKAQQARMSEVDKYIARVIYHGGRIVASYQLPSGDIVDFIDRDTLDPLPYALPALPFKPQDMVPPPGVQHGGSDLEQFPETAAWVARATPFNRPTFWPYVLGETDAVSIEDYLNRYTVGGGPR